MLFLDQGTLQFMSIEVELGAYEHSPRTLSTVGLKPPQAIAHFLSKKAPNLQGFFYNFLHDLESLWWITQFMLFFHHNSSLKKLDDEQTKQRLKDIRSIFPSPNPATARPGFFKTEHTHAKRTKSLYASYAVSLLANLAVARDRLVVESERFESALPEVDKDLGLHMKEFWQKCKNESQSLEDYVGLHEYLKELWEMCKTETQSIELAPLIESKKRKSELTENEAESSKRQRIHCTPNSDLDHINNAV